jgi:uncharacterized protein YecT (DUF1311 family)
MMKPLLLTYLLSCFLCPALHAEDSAKAKSPTLPEVKAAYEKADKRLNAAWSKAKTELDAATLATLTTEQRDWLAYRDEQSLTSVDTGGKEVLEEKLKQTAEFLDSAADMTQSRAIWLESLLKDPGAEDTLTGTWSDSFGGKLNIVQTGSKFFFTVDVVRGPTFHTGNIGGIASWNEPLGWFSDKGKDPEKKEETNLAFIHRHSKMEIVAANAGDYGGARAYFDGHYVRIAKLSDPQSAKVKKEALEGPEGQ